MLENLESTIVKKYFIYNLKHLMEQSPKPGGTQAALVQMQALISDYHCEKDWTKWALSNQIGRHWQWQDVDIIQVEDNYSIAEVKFMCYSIVA